MSYSAASILTRPGLIRDRLTGYWELTKPRVVAMVLITALAGFYMACGTDFDLAVALRMLLGTALAAGGTLALNEFLERDLDARMHRTRERPLPSGRLRPTEALVFGLLIAAGGIAYLYVRVNPLTASITSAITLLYLGVYTPMKRVSWLCHMVGGVPGALPPVIGWAAARGSLEPEAFVLFGIMLLWQLPHSLSIARLYQSDYARAGLSLLPADRPYGNPANAVMLTAAAMLTGFGMLPAWLGFAGRIYLAVAALLGIWMFYSTVRLVRSATISSAARSVMFVSLIYLPAVLLVMVLDKL